MASDPRTAFEDIADATCALDLHRLLRRQLHRKIVTLYPQWAFVMYQAQDFKKVSKVWGKPFIILQRYIRRRGKWRRHSHVTLRGPQSMEVLKTAALWHAMAAEFSAQDIDLGAAVDSAEAGAKPKKKARRRADAEPDLEIEQPQPT